MYRQILVPLDGSRTALHALPAALGLARRSRASIRLVHVHPSGSPPEEPGSPSQSDAAAEYLRGVAKLITAAGDVSATASVLEGPAALTLGEHATRIGADLTALTTHGEGGVSRAWIGSVADTLLRRARVPLLMIRPGPGEADLQRERRFVNLLLLLDGSVTAEQILKPAAAIASLDDAAYCLCSVVNPAGSPAPAGARPARSEREQIDRRRRFAEAYLERLARSLRARSRRVTTTVVISRRPAMAILDTAAETAADLIALVTRGETYGSGDLLGSIADKVIRTSSTPVLLLAPCPR